MAKVTWILRRFDRDEGKVGIDGTCVHVQHPDDPTQILDMPHPTEAAAFATVKTVITKFFNSHHGWKLWLKQDGHVDVASWRPKPPAPPSPEAIAAARSREIGYAIAGTTMVLSLKRQARASDLDMALDKAGDVTALHVLISQHDDDGVGRSALFDRLCAGAVPKATTLTFESPWESRRETAGLSLPGLTELLAARPIVELAAVGAFAWPDAAVPALKSVRLHDKKLAVAHLARISRCTELRIVQLALPFEGTAAARLPLEQLDELALEYVGDVGATMIALLDRRVHLPARVHLQGDGRPLKMLHAAIARWHREAPHATLTFGDWPTGQLDDETRAAAAAAGIVPRVSPFAAEARDPELRRLWAPFE